MFNKLKKELATYLVLLALFILFMIGAVSFWIIWHSQQQLLQKTQQQVAMRVSQEVEYLLQTAANNLKLVVDTNHFAVKQSSVQHDILFDFLHQQQEFDHIALYDSALNVTFQTHRHLSFTEWQAFPLHEALLQEIPQHPTILFGELNYDPVTGEPSVLIALPVVHLKKQQLTQIIIGSLRFRNLWNIMAREASDSGRSVFLVADNQQIIAHHNPGMVFGQQQYSASTAGNNDSMITASWPLQLGNRTYQVISQQPKLSALPGTAGYSLLLLFVIVLSIISAFALAKWLSGRITLPLNQLVKSANEIANGNLSEPVIVSGHNELALLGRHFDVMRSTLKNTIVKLRENNEALQQEIDLRRTAETSLVELNQQLEQRVKDRTEQLSEIIQSLKSTQASLVQSEKLAGLGALVAGVSHELNTPIGNALIMADTLQMHASKLTEQLNQGLRKSELDEFLSTVSEASQILLSSLQQSTRLISSFKQMAVDQTSYQQRLFSLRNVIDEALLSMSPTIKRHNLTLHIQIKPEIMLNSYPGPISQIILNMINNAILHAFDSPGGELWISAYTKEELVVLEIRDNGKGISQADLKRIFDPFFTSKLGQGGSGLGLNIVFNLINGILGGQINATSEPGKGTAFTIELPMSAPERTAQDPGKTAEN